MHRVTAVLLCLTIPFEFTSGQEANAHEFYEVIRQNDLARLKAMSASAADANTRDSRGSTPLMYAAAIGSLEAMKVLLAAGADVNAKNGLDATALLYGAASPEKVRLLLDAGAEVNVRSKIGRTPLLVAAGVPGAGRTVRLLLARGADPNAADIRAHTPLLEAASVNDLESLKILLNHKVDLDAGDFVGLTALAWAAGHSNLEAVKLLLAKGADVNAAHERKIPVRNGNVAVSRMTPLMTAVPRGSPNVVRILLEAGAKLNATDVRGMTPLMLAVASDVSHPQVVRMLLDRNADRESKSVDGENALDWARKFGQPEVVRLLGGTVSEFKVRPVVAGQPNSNVQMAVERAVSLLQASSGEYFKQSGCVGCHHQNLAAVAVAAAGRKGIRTNEPAAAEQLRITKTEWQSRRDVVLQGVFISVDGLAYSLFQLAEQGYPADEVTDALVASVAAKQAPDGGWGDFPLVRPPLEDSVMVRSALAIRGLTTYSIPARKAEFDERIARARHWLIESRPALPYDRAFQLLGLTWSKAQPKAIEKSFAELLRLQRPDGGWAQLAHLPSDAFATGVALYALSQSGIQQRTGAYARGVRFLLSTQQQDGSWHVRSRAPKFQPYFQSGFPHDHDQWISAAATAWAAAALAEGADPSTRSASVSWKQ